MVQALTFYFPKFKILEKKLRFFESKLQTKNLRFLEIKRKNKKINSG